MKYKHFEGGEYTYICEAEDVGCVGEPHGQLVIYKDSNGKIWSRLKSEFYGYVEKKRRNSKALC